MNSILCILTMFVLYLASTAAMSIRSDKAVGIRAFDVDVKIPESCLEKWASFNNSLTTGNKKNEPSHFYCSSKPDNYPEAEFDSYIERTKKMRFPKLEDPLGVYTEDEHCGLDEEGRNCCSKSAREKFFFVESEKTLKLVVQTGVFDQAIRTTKCGAEGASCFQDFDPSGMGIRTSCRTDYGSIMMLVYNPHSQQLETVPVTIPVSCSCHFELKKSSI